MSLLDPRGCLTGAALAALARAPVGQAPPEIAAHLAGCPRCQDRLLGADRAKSREARADAEPRPYLKLAIVGGLLLAALLLLAITLVVVSGR
jgi:hypothetical protein